MAYQGGAGQGGSDSSFPEDVSTKGWTCRLYQVGASPLPCGTKPDTAQSKREPWSLIGGDFVVMR